MQSIYCALYSCEYGCCCWMFSCNCVLLVFFVFFFTRFVKLTWLDSARPFVAYAEQFFDFVFYIYCYAILLLLRSLNFRSEILLFIFRWLFFFFCRHLLLKNWRGTTRKCSLQLKTFTIKTMMTMAPRHAATKVPTEKKKKKETY